MQDDFNESVMNRTDLTALEKFRVLWRHSMTKQDHVQIMRPVMPMLSDPVSFAANMQVWSKHLPERFLPLIEVGVKDGSIPTEYPREAAELLSLLPNYWLMPYFYPATLPKRSIASAAWPPCSTRSACRFSMTSYDTVAAKGMMTFAGEPEKGSQNE